MKIDYCTAIESHHSHFGAQCLKDSKPTSIFRSRNLQRPDWPNKRLTTKVINDGLEISYPSFDPDKFSRSPCPLVADCTHWDFKPERQLPLQRSRSTHGPDQWFRKQWNVKHG